MCTFYLWKNLCVPHGKLLHAYHQYVVHTTVWEPLIYIVGPILRCVYLSDFDINNETAMHIGYFQSFL